jgi:hypothetical protein
LSVDERAILSVEKDDDMHIEMTCENQPVWRESRRLYRINILIREVDLLHILGPSLVHLSAAKEDNNSFRVRV